MIQSTSIDAKAALRQQAIAHRDALPPRERQQAAEIIAAHEFPRAVAGMIVSGFMPLKSEISPLPLMRKVAAAGAQLALPVVAGRGKPLVMRAYAFGDELAPANGEFGNQNRKHRKSRLTF